MIFWQITESGRVIPRLSKITPCSYPPAIKSYIESCFQYLSTKSPDERQSFSFYNGNQRYR